MDEGVEGAAVATSDSRSSGSDGDWALPVRQFVRGAIMEGRVSEAVHRIKTSGIAEVWGTLGRC